MKKTLSLILAVMMIICALPMQSFAAFDWLRPKVVKVEFMDDIPVSNKYVQSANYEIFESVSLDNCKYLYKLYLSNGRTIETNNYDLLGADLLSGIAFTAVYMRTDPKECAKAIAEGKSTVKVNVGVSVYYVNNTLRSYHFEMEKPIVEEIVKEVKLIDPMPENYNKFLPDPAFVGKKFEVKYADGKTETLIFEDMGDDGYYLGEEPVYLWCGEDKYVDKVTGETVYYEGLEFFYIDTDVILERKYLPCPYSSFEITDYKLDGKAGIAELSYKLTYKDGRVIEKSFTFDKPLTSENYVVIDTVDGYDVLVGVEGWSDYYYIDAGIGYTVWEIEDFIEGDITDFCDCRCHKNDLLNIIVHTLICKVWEIFSINEYCKCGMFHW